MVGLLGPHGPAVDQGDPLHAEPLLQQAPLRPHIVDMAHHPAVLGQAQGAVAGAAGAAVAELAHQHHAPALRIEDRAHHPRDVFWPGAVGAGVEHQVGAIGVEAAVHPVVEAGIPQLLATGEAKGPQLEELIPSPSATDPAAWVTRAGPERRDRPGSDGAPPGSLGRCAPGGGRCAGGLSPGHETAPRRTGGAPRDRACSTSASAAAPGCGWCGCWPGRHHCCCSRRARPAARSAAGAGPGPAAAARTRAGTRSPWH